MKTLKVLAIALLMSAPTLSWATSSWSGWYPSWAQASRAALAGCYGKYQRTCVVTQCQKRAYRYNYQWRCAADKPKRYSGGYYRDDSRRYYWDDSGRYDSGRYDSGRRDRGRDDSGRRGGRDRYDDH